MRTLKLGLAALAVFASVALTTLQYWSDRDPLSFLEASALPVLTIAAGGIVCGWLCAGSGLRHPIMWGLLIYYAASRMALLVAIVWTAPVFFPGPIVDWVPWLLGFGAIPPPGAAFSMASSLWESAYSVARLAMVPLGVAVANRAAKRSAVRADAAATGG